MRNTNIRDPKLTFCPKCGEELIDNGKTKNIITDTIGRTRKRTIIEKECLECELRFRRKSGYHQQWIEYGAYEYD